MRGGASGKTRIGEADPPAKSLGRVWRAVAWIAGSCSLVLAVLGLFLPVLPTTPFLLLTAACWARASPRLHHWLLSHPRFGPLLDQWQRHRSLPRRAKRAAIAMLSLSLGGSIYLVRAMPWLQVLLLAVGVAVGTWLWRLPDGPGDRARRD